jgi:hypothetical protein
VRKVKIKAFLPITIILLMTITVSMSRADPPKPRIYVNPPDNVFSTTTTPVGTNFTINITAADWPSPGVFSYQLKLQYNNSFLEAVAAQIPLDHWLKPSAPANIFPVDSGTINHTLGSVTFAVTLLGSESGKTGSGTIATVTFKITQAPTTGNITSTLSLPPGELILVDPDSNEISQTQYDIVNGNYTYMGAAPPPKPKPQIYVDPKNNVFLPSNGTVGTTFTISIKTVNWTAPGVLGYNFKLFYNNTQLQATAASLPTGHWLTPVDPNNISIADPGTINQTLGFVSFAATLNGTEPGKTGSGTISTITFNITQPPPTGGNLSCTLTIGGMTLTDPSNATISPDTYEIVSGNYLFSAAAPPTNKQDLNGDGKIDIQDITIWGLAFGSRPGHPRWNPNADINGDGKVDMVDAIKICKAWTGP